MSRADFTKIAEMTRQRLITIENLDAPGDPVTIKRFMHDLCGVFLEINPRFDATDFMSACGITDIYEPTR